MQRHFKTEAQVLLRWPRNFHKSDFRCRVRYLSSTHSFAVISENIIIHHSATWRTKKHS